MTKNNSLMRISMHMKSMIEDMSKLQANYEKLNNEIALVNQNIVKLQTNYEWIRWMTVAIAIGVIATSVKVWLV